MTDDSDDWDVTHQRLLQDLRELCDAAQAVLDGKAVHVDSAGDRYVLDSTLRRLEAVLTAIVERSLAHADIKRPLR